RCSPTRPRLARRVRRIRALLQALLVVAEVLAEAGRQQAVEPLPCRLALPLSRLLKALVELLFEEPWELRARPEAAELELPRVPPISTPVRSLASAEAEAFVVRPQ